MFYSSTFLSIILAFFVFLNLQGESITIIQKENEPAFANIVRTDTATETILAQHYARLTLEVFDRFGCGQCDRMAKEIMPTLRQRYEHNDEVKFSVFLSPDPRNEAQMDAARGLICAGEQGKYWEMYNALHTEWPLDKRGVDLTAQGFDVDIVAFRKCLAAEETAAKLQEEISYAAQKKVTRMPTIFVNEYSLSYFQPIENIDRMIRRVTRSGDVVTPLDQ